MKKIIFILMTLLFSTVAFSLFYNVNNILNQSDPFNLSLTADNTSTFYIPFPYIYIINSTLEVSPTRQTLTPYLTDNFNQSDVNQFRFYNNLNDTLNSSKSIFNSTGYVGFIEMTYGQALNISNDPTYYSGKNIFRADNKSISIMAYINSSEGAGGGAVVVEATGISIDDHVRLRFTPTDIQCISTFGGTQYDSSQGIYSSLKGAPFWFTCVFQAGQPVKMYINKTLYEGDNITMDSFNLTGNLTVGRALASNNFWFGDIDELLIFYDYGLSYLDVNNTIDTYDLQIDANITINSSVSSAIIYDGSLTESVRYQINSSDIIAVINNSCDCEGCIFNNDFCNIPVQYTADNNINITTEIINISGIYTVDECVNSINIPSNATTYNITWYDFNNDQKNVNTSLAFYENGNVTSPVLYNNSINLVNSVKLCMYPSWYNTSVFAQIQYYYLEGTYDYYANGTILNNNTKFLSLYVDEGELVVATVFDNQNNKVEDAYIHVQKYDVDSNSYKLVSIARTNFEGEANLYLIKNTQFYRFLIYRPLNFLRKTTSPTYITGSSIEFQIDLFDDIGEIYDTVSGVDYSLSFNNNTNNFRYIFSDPSANIEGGTLKTFKIMPQGSVLINTTSISGTSGTILQGITPINDTTYLAKAYVTIDGSLYYIDEVSQRYYGTNVIGFMGLLVAFVLTIVFAFLFRFSIPLGIIAIPLPTLLLSMVGLIQLNVFYAIGIEIVAVILAILINERG